MKKVALFLVLFSLVGLTACSQISAAVFPPTETSTPTITLTSTATVTSTATSTPTEIPTPTLSPTPEPNRYFEKSEIVKFSYIPPENWQKARIVNNIQGYRGPDKSLLAFQTLGSSPSAKEAAEIWLQRMMGSADYEVISEGSFATNANVDAYKMVVKSKEVGKSTEIVFYYFQADSNIVLANFMRNWDLHPDIDAIIDRLMATFRFE